MIKRSPGRNEDRRLPTLGTEADVKETEAMLAAALEIADGKR